MVKSYTAVVWAVAALVLTTTVAPAADAHGLRGSHGGWHDAHEEHAPFFGEDEAPTPEIGGEGSVMDLESEPMVDPDYDPSDVGREEDKEVDESEEEDVDSEEDGSEAAESDLSDDTNASEHVNTFDWEALAALERGASSVKSEVTQSVPAPLPVIPMSSKPAPPPAVASSTTTPPPIGESAAAAKDISSIDSSAIQRDPESYGVATTTPSAVSSSTPKPVTIGESAAAAKDISSIDSSAIQRDPKSYGVATPAPSSKPLNETPAAAKPMDPTQVTTSLADSPMAAKPTTSTSTQAENSPKQRSYDANDDGDELDH